ncbi:MAG: HD domain-containing protein [Bacilli bacterium]|nr:HD domain-containing protein [Bacilli bacterium]
MSQKAIIFFEDFVKQFDLEKDKSNIESYYHKYHHTYRVMKKIEELGHLLHLNQEEMEFAKTIALFHDLGRFHQLKKTKQYDDLKTNFDHAKESIFILEENNWFINEAISEDVKEIISFAILNHNQYEIEQTPNETSSYFAKLLRDANKLVIMTEMNPVLKDSSISKEVLQEFQKEMLIHRQNIQTPLDNILGYLGFLFDLNFKETIILLEQEKILESYWLCLEKNLDFNTFHELQEIVNKYLEKRKKEMLC